LGVFYWENCNPTKSVNFLRTNDSGEFRRSQSEIAEGVKFPEE